MIRNSFITVIMLLLPSLRVMAREVVITLDEAISMARVHSVDAAEALDELKAAYWQWRSFRADQLPEVNFSASLPSYSKQYSAYMDSEGKYSFVRSNVLECVGQFSVTQNIRLTGGKIALNSSLDFLRDLDDNANSFMTIPVALTLTQPLFGVNTMRWDSRIEPVRYEEAKAEFMSATEDVAAQAVTYYFSLIMSRENVDISSQNLANAEKLYSVAVEKRKMGQISENDLLQMELNMLNAKSELTGYQSTLKYNMFQLRTFLDLGEDVEIVPVLPDSVPTAEISYSDALDRALANNKLAKNLVRRQLEADYQVAKAKGDLREISLFVQIGYTGTDSKLASAYNNLRANQVAQIGFSIPILDWGKRRGNVKTAESNRRVVESQVRRDAQNFNQELFILVERFCNQQSQLDIATRADEIAQRRYNTNVETYLIGKISTLDLNDSQVSKDESRREYINELYKFWTYWYQLRSLTLYDYSLQRDINADIETLIKM